MKPNEKLTETIRQSIKEALEQVDNSNAPRVFELIQTEQGYKTVEELIINQMVLNEFTASASILHVEMSL